MNIWLQSHGSDKHTGHFGAICGHLLPWQEPKNKKIKKTRDIVTLYQWTKYVGHIMDNCGVMAWDGQTEQ